MKIKTGIISFSLTTALLLSGVHVIKQEMTLSPKDITYNNLYDGYDDTYYAKYKDKDVYISNKNIGIESDKNTISIVDLRHSQEDIKIISSYRITDIFECAQIIDIILEYNGKNPSDPLWIRTKQSLLREWIAHNICYYLDSKTINYYISHTADVDFENNEENKYLLFK